MQRMQLCCRAFHGWKLSYSRFLFAICSKRCLASQVGVPYLSLGSDSEEGRTWVQRLMCVTIAAEESSRVWCWGVELPDPWRPGCGSKKTGGRDLGWVFSWYFFHDFSLTVLDFGFLKASLLMKSCNLKFGSFWLPLLFWEMVMVGKHWIKEAALGASNAWHSELMPRERYNTKKGWCMGGASVSEG